MDKIVGGSPCLFDTMVAILFDVDDVVMLSKLGASFQRLLNKLYEYCISSKLGINLPRTKITIFGENIRNLINKDFYL